MRNHLVLFRLSAAIAVAATALGSVVPVPARAAAGDPPSRVGRLSSLVGTVSYHTVDQSQWSPATLNYPVTTGDSFWTEPNSSAQVEIGATHMALDQQTQLDMELLDNTQMSAIEAQGATYLRVGMVNPGDAYTIRTPRGSVSIAAAGRYEIVAGDSDRPTTVTVVEGHAQITGDPDLSLTVGPHQTATITGSDQFQGGVGAETDDPFLSAQLAAERPVPLAAGAPAAPRGVVYQPPPVVQQMTGAADLQTSGTWEEAPQYGHVWYPPVEPGWVPYRHGHWAYVAPWGWTWVDEAQWGFAPYHYGRWVDVDDRWGWVPVAPDAPAEVAPVYSPALVDFVGIAAGVALGAAIGVGVGLAVGGRGRGNIGWVPLGFHEPYIPPYGGSAGYLDGLNRPNFGHSQNVSQIINQRRSFVNNGTINRNTTTINNYYANAAGATVAPAAALQTGQPVAGLARPVTARQFAQIAQPRAAVPTPTAQTVGVTPAVAQRFNIPSAQLLHPAPAPGPAVQPRLPGRVALPVTASAPGVTPAVRPPASGVPGAAMGAAGVAAVGAAALAARAAAPAHPRLPPLASHGAAAAAQSVSRAGAPGPAIVPHAATAPAIPVPGPAGRPTAVPPAVDAAPHPQAGPAIVPHNAANSPLTAAAPGAGADLAPHPANAATPPGPAAHAAEAPPRLAAPVAPHPATVAPPAPAPHPALAPAHASAAAPLPAPSPVPHAPPPAVHVATPPAMAAPAPRPPPPVVHAAPPPVVHVAPPPPPVVHTPPPPVVHAAPPPPPRPAPPPLRPAPPPAPRPAPPPPPPPHKVCPPGKPVC